MHTPRMAAHSNDETTPSEIFHKHNVGHSSKSISVSVWWMFFTAPARDETAEQEEMRLGEIPILKGKRAEIAGI